MRGPKHHRATLCLLVGLSVVLGAVEIRAQPSAIPPDDSVRPLLDGRYLVIEVVDEIMGEADHERLVAEFGDPDTLRGEVLHLDDEIAAAVGVSADESRPIVWMVGPEGPCRSRVLAPVTLPGRGGEDLPFTLALELDPCTEDPTPVVFVGHEPAADVVWIEASTIERGPLRPGEETFEAFFASRLATGERPETPAAAGDGTGDGASEVASAGGCYLVRQAVGEQESLVALFLASEIAGDQRVGVLTARRWLELPFSDIEGGLFRDGRVVLAVAGGERFIEHVRASAWGLAIARRVSADTFAAPHFLPTNFSAGEYDPPNPLFDEAHPLFEETCAP
jgi:hypothetical protein